MTKHKHSLSVVIPAHNEESCIENCINSLLRQNILPKEIIVVVNASNDKTAEIARKYQKVKVIEIDKKSITNARNIGFNLAKSEIIARLNADVVCPNNWSETLLGNFENPDISATTGPARTKTIPFTYGLSSTFWSKMYLNLAEVYFGFPILWGANMAIKRSAWEDIKGITCLSDFDVHEDQDLSLHLAEKNRQVKIDNSLVVHTMETSYFNWDKFRSYNKLRVRTKKSHKYIYTRKPVYKTPILKRLYLLLKSLLPAVVFYSASVTKLYAVKLYKVFVR